MSQTLQNPYDPVGWHGTTILCVRKGPQVAMAGDGQVTLGQTVIKGNARKVRRIGGGSVIAGFAGATQRQVDIATHPPAAGGGGSHPSCARKPHAAPLP